LKNDRQLDNSNPPLTVPKTSGRFGSIWDSCDRL